MSFERAKRGLGRFGYIWVILGGILAVIGIILLIMGKVNSGDAADTVTVSMLYHAGITDLVLGLIGLDTGYRCFKATKDLKKVKDVITIARIFILLAILAMLAGFVRGTLAANTVSSCITTIIVNGFMLYIAYVVKKGLKAENAEAAETAEKTETTETAETTEN